MIWLPVATILYHSWNGWLGGVHMAALVREGGGMGIGLVIIDWQPALVWAGGKRPVYRLKESFCDSLAKSALTSIPQQRSPKVNSPKANT